MQAYTMLDSGRRVCFSFHFPSTLLPLRGNHSGNLVGCPISKWDTLHFNLRADVDPSARVCCAGKGGKLP